MKSRALMLVLIAGCGSGEPSDKPQADPEKLPFLELGDFPYKERMKLPQRVTKWDQKYVLVTGYINPVNQTRDLQQFLLVKDRASCCFGKLPQLNHFIEVTLKQGQTLDYTRDPVTVKGVLQIGEVWDEDWLAGLYVMKNAEKVE